MGACYPGENQPSTVQIGNLKIQYLQFKKSFNETLKIDQSTLKQKIISQHIARRVSDQNISADAKTFSFTYPLPGYIVKQVSEENKQKPIEDQIFDGKVAGVYLLDSQMKQFKNFYYGKLDNYMASDQKGLYVFQNGDQYIGNIINNKATGKGVYIDQSKKFKYEGDWKDNLPEGVGTQQTQDYIYSGEFSNGKKQGKGELKYKIGGVTYQGGFINNLFDGLGSLKKQQKQVYKGQFKNGSQSGHGSWFGQNGETYEGQFQKGKKHGQGKYTFSDGTVYDGEFKNGMMNGEGTIIKGQQRKHGVWMDNKNMMIFDS